MNIKTTAKAKITTHKKEYPDLTLDELKAVNKLRNQGMSEKEALKEVMNSD